MPHTRKTKPINYSALNSRGDSTSSSSSSSSGSSASASTSGSSSSSSSSSSPSEGSVPEGKTVSPPKPAANEDASQKPGKPESLDVIEEEVSTEDLVLSVETGMVDQRGAHGGARPKVLVHASDSEDDTSLAERLQSLKQKEDQIRSKIKREKLRKEVHRREQEVESLEAVLESESPAPRVSVSKKKSQNKKAKKGKITREKYDSDSDSPRLNDRPNLKILIPNDTGKSGKQEVLFDSDAEMVSLEENHHRKQGSKAPKGQGFKGVTVKELRRNPQVCQTADKALQNLGLLEEDISSSDDGEATAQQGAQGKSMKSGMEVKASQRVVKQLLWPHVTLQYEFVSRDLAFKDLDLKLLGAGELEIVTRANISEAERNARLEILKNLFYFSSQHDITTIRSMYAAIMRQVEVGGWGSHGTAGCSR